MPIPNHVCVATPKGSRNGISNCFEGAVGCMKTATGSLTQHKRGGAAMPALPRTIQPRITREDLRWGLDIAGRDDEGNRDWSCEMKILAQGLMG